MNKIYNPSDQKMEALRYESFLNAVEQAFMKHKTGVRRVDRTMLQFAEEVVSKFAAIYANSRDEKLGDDLKKIILKQDLHLN